MSTINSVKKPIPLRVIFIMNGILMILPFLFYFAATSLKKDVGIEPILMIYTGIGYIVSFALVVLSILKKKLILFRVVFVLLALMSVPAGALIGIGVAIISIVISFNKKVKAYFKA